MCEIGSIEYDPDRARLCKLLAAYFDSTNFLEMQVRSHDIYTNR